MLGRAQVRYRRKADAVSTVEPAPGTTGPVGASSGTLSVEKAWMNLMRRIGVTNPALVQDGHRLLNGVDRITGIKSR